MTEPQMNGASRSHVLLISSDQEFVDRATDVLHTRMRVAQVSAADSRLQAVVQSADPDLFIVDVDDVDWQVSGRMTTIEQLRAWFPDTPIAFTSFDISTTTLVPAMRAGANDVFDKSTSDDVILAVADQWISHRSTRVAAGDGRVITTMGLRAGVGTTTLCLALAQALSDSDRDHAPVLYLDFSAPPCEAGDLLDVKANYSMIDAVNDLSRLDSSVVESAFSRAGQALYVLPFLLEDDVPDPRDVGQIPNLILVLKSLFKYIFVDPNQDFLSRAVFDRLFCDSDVSILCTDQSVTSIHACSAFLQKIRQSVATQPQILLAINRYDPGISPNADVIARTIRTGQDHHIIPWDRQYVDGRRNAGLPLMHPGARKPFADSINRLMARIDAEFASTHNNISTQRKTWRKLLRLAS
jgi:pilus assembly protein CpaE